MNADGQKRKRECETLLDNEVRCFKKTKGEEMICIRKENNLKEEYNEATGVVENKDGVMCTNEISEEDEKMEELSTKICENANMEDEDRQEKKKYDCEMEKFIKGGGNYTIGKKESEIDDVLQKHGYTKVDEEKCDRSGLKNVINDATEEMRNEIKVNKKEEEELGVDDKTNQERMDRITQKIKKGEEEMQMTEIEEIHEDDPEYLKEYYKAIELELEEIEGIKGEGKESDDKSETSEVSDDTAPPPDFSEVLKYENNKLNRDEEGRKTEDKEKREEKYTKMPISTMYSDTENDEEIIAYVRTYCT